MSARTFGFRLSAFALCIAGGVALGQEQLPNGGEAEKKNPLPELVERMKEVERKLAEAETGDWSQTEQQEIAKKLVMDQDGLVSDLQKLIDEIESSAQQGGGQGGDPSGKRSKGKGGAQKQPKKERDNGGQEKPANPEGDKPQGQKGEQNQDQSGQTEEPKKSEGDSGDSSYNGDRNRQAGQGEPWGNLPPKQRGEVIDAQRREKPTAWRKQIEEYLKKLAQPKK